MSDFFQSPKDKSSLFLGNSLCDGIEDKNLKQLSVLLEQKHADPNVYIPSIGVTPFHVTLLQEPDDFSKDAIKLFLLHGGNPNVKSSTGKTPVHMAVMYERADILKLLLNNGGDPLCLDYDGCSPFHYAFERQNYDIVTILCDYSRGLQTHEEHKKYKINLEKVLLDDGNIIAEYTPNISECVLINDISNDNDYIINKKLCDRYKEFYDQLRTHSEIVIGNQNCFNSFENTNPIEKPQEVNKIKMDSFKTCIDTSYSDGSSCNHNNNDNSSLIGNTNDSNLTNKNDLEVRETSIYKVNFNQSNSLGNYKIDFNKINIIDEDKQNYLLNSDNNNSLLEFKLQSKLTNKTMSDAENIPEKATKFSITENDNLTMSDKNTNEGMFFINEEYKYSDNEENVILLERRLCTPTHGETSDNNTSFYSCKHAEVWCPLSNETNPLNPPPILLRQKLIEYGQAPGPITLTTYGVYLKRFQKLTKARNKFSKLNGYKCTDAKSDKVITALYNYDVKMKAINDAEQDLLSLDCNDKLLEYEQLEEEMYKKFVRPDLTRKWREGTSKNSFNYLLLDPRITLDLPRRISDLTEEEKWQTFLSAIFYIGKGKRTRPYAHLYDAFHIWSSRRKVRDVNEKCRRIINIWNEGQGVITLHIFQNIIPVEAYTREALMIEAIGLQNLANCKHGEIYGPANIWPSEKKRKLGKFLLFKAMKILMLEGEKQLFPENI